MREAVLPGIISATISRLLTWQKRGDIRSEAKPANIAEVMLSFFLGYVVQSAMIGGINPDTAAKGFEGIISSQLGLRRWSRKYVLFFQNLAD